MSCTNNGFRKLFSLGLIIFSFMLFPKIMNHLKKYFMCFVCVYVCVPYVCLVLAEVKRRASDALDLELNMAVRHVPPGSRTQLLCKSHKHSTAQAPLWAPCAFLGASCSLGWPAKQLRMTLTFQSPAYDHRSVPPH